MGIQDSLGLAAGGVGCLAPTTAFSSSPGYDLNPDFGTGQSARKSPLFSQGGEELLMRVTLTTAFTVALGTPVAQFHMVLSDTAAAVATQPNFCIIGSNLGPLNIIGARRHAGYIAADLTIGRHIFIRANPWTAIMGRSHEAVPVTLVGKDLRYVGLMITNPHSDVGPSAFGTNVCTWNFVKIGDVMENPEDFIYPAATVHVG